MSRCDKCPYNDGWRGEEIICMLDRDPRDCMVDRELQGYEEAEE